MEKLKEVFKGLSKKQLLVFVVGGLLLLTGVSYAFFTASSNWRGFGNSTKGEVSSYAGTDLITTGILEFTDTGILPGHENLSSIEVNAKSGEDGVNIIYNLIWKGTNTLKTPLTYSVYKTSDKINPTVTCERVTETENGVTKYFEECRKTKIEELGGVVGSGTIPGNITTETKINLTINEEISASVDGTKAYYYVILEYPNLNESQNYDMGGAFSGIVTTEILGEKEMPVVTLNEEYVEASNGWYTSVKVSANGINSINTVTSLRYCITDSDTCTPTEDNTINKNIGYVELENNKNSQRICFAGVDKNGLQGLPTCSNIYKVDNTNTTVEITVDDDKSIEGNNNWYQALTLNIKGINEISGISTIKYCLTSTDSCDPTEEVNDTITSITLNSSEVGQKICALSIDNKGATSEVECSNLYNVDTINPEVEIDDYTVTSDSIIVNVVASDNDSKVSSYSYTLNGEEYDSCTTSTCTFTNLVDDTNYIVGVKVTDLSGRTSEEVTETINFSKYDFKILAMYQETESGDYEEIDAMPSSGYKINEEKSYCNISGTDERDTNAKLYTNLSGEHVMGNLKKKSNCYVWFDEYNPYAAKEKIISNASNVTSMPSITGTSSETTNKLYTTFDDDGTSYVFRGNPSNNWIKFAGFYWRIIRVNGDGTIRMIYNGTSTTTTGTGTQISGTHAYNTSRNDNAYVGFMYGATRASTYEATHTNTNKSNVMTQLEIWYRNNMQNYTSYINKNTGFCNDRQPMNGVFTNTSFGTLGYGTALTAYAPMGRLYQNDSWKTTQTPSLKCTNVSNDLFTMGGAIKGNKKLTYPVGLITSDEVVFAGGFGNAVNKSYYLYTNQYYWAMSPGQQFYDTSHVSYIHPDGSIGFNLVDSLYGIRPVINLRSDVTLSGSGTSSDPYTVS